MNKQIYQELLKDPRWIKRRNEILTRDKNTCQSCGAQDKYLHVHHHLQRMKRAITDGMAYAKENNIEVINI